MGGGGDGRVFFKVSAENRRVDFGERGLPVGELGGNVSAGGKRDFVANGVTHGYLGAYGGGGTALKFTDLTLVLFEEI